MLEIAKERSSAIITRFLRIIEREDMYPLSPTIFFSLIISCPIAVSRRYICLIASINAMEAKATANKILTPESTPNVPIRHPAIGVESVPML